MRCGDSRLVNVHNTYMQRHTKTLFILGILAILIALAVSLFIHASPSMDQNVPFGTDNDGVEVPLSKASMIQYSNSQNHISFEYPSNLFIKEVDHSSTSSRTLGLILVQNIGQNKDFINSSTTMMSEGPTTITLDVYPNPQKLSTDAWAKKNDEWKTFTNATSTETLIGGERGFTFHFSGLYEGKEYVVAKNDYAYVFRVTWLTENDQLIRDMDMILNSLNLN